MSFRVLIAEDEQLIAERTRKMLLDIAPEAIVEAITDSITATIDWLKHNNQPDLLLLDIQLADGNSFRIFEQLSIRFPVIFITAYNEYAVQAFRVNSIDYLLKPLKADELKQAIERFKERQQKNVLMDYQQLIRAFEKPEPAYAERFMVKIGQQIKTFSIADVAYFYIVEKNVFAMLNSGDRLPLDETLDSLEKRTDPKKFFRINRHFFIGFHAIDKMFAYSKSRIKILLKPPCEEDAVSSTERSPLFRNWLSGNAN